MHKCQREYFQVHLNSHIKLVLTKILSPNTCNDLFFSVTISEFLSIWMFKKLDLILIWLAPAWYFNLNILSIDYTDSFKNKIKSLTLDYFPDNFSYCYNKSFFFSILFALIESIFFRYISIGRSTPMVTYLQISQVQCEISWSYYKNTRFSYCATNFNAL